MNRHLLTGLALLCLAALACGTLQVAVEGTPTADAAATGTVGALQTQNSQLLTQVAQPNQPTQAPTVAAPSQAPASQVPPSPRPTTTIPVPAATRITFLSGATVGVVNAPIPAGQLQNYVLGALQGQPMFVYIGSLNNDVTVSIRAPNGTTILSSTAHRNSWQGTLPQTGDYYLTVHGGATTENFSLTVTVPSRVQFDAGATTTTLTGKTVGGYGVSYALLAGKGQSMQVELETHSGKAALSIYGFTDGQPYLRSATEQTSFHFVLPATQDYIVVVVPKDNGVVNYTLAIKIE